MTPAPLRKIELILLCVCAAVLGAQLFIPPTVGLADNGDFARVFARFSLAHVRGGEDNYAYFAPRYWFTPDIYEYEGGPSSEVALAAIPIELAKLLRSGIFDIRWLGALHALLFLAGYYALLVYLRRWGSRRQLLLGAAAIWIFGDVAYVAYCNSFFWDTAAMLGVLLTVPLALQVATSKASEWALLLFAGAALLFITSKPQHAFAGAVPALMAAWVLRRKRLAVLLAGALWLAVASSPVALRGKPLFNLIFSKITARSATARQDLAELGLGDRDLPYVGMQTTTPGNPAQNPAWLDGFVHRTGYGKLAWFYLRHPVRMLGLAGNVLSREAFQIRPQYLGNFRRSEGFPPGTISASFDSWSTLRTTLFIRWWWHIVVWYALFGIAAFRLGRNSAAARVAFGIMVMAVLEFAVASLGDAVDTSRHLLIFHLLTDVTILFALGWVLNSALLPANRRDSAAVPADRLPANF